MIDSISLAVITVGFVDRNDLLFPDNPFGCSSTRALLETKRPEERVCFYLCSVGQRYESIAL